MSEYDELEFEAPAGVKVASDKEETGEGEMTDDELGLALKKALSGGSGSAICELVRRIKA